MKDKQDNQEEIEVDEGQNQEQSLDYKSLYEQTQEKLEKQIDVNKKISAENKEKRLKSKELEEKNSDYESRLSKVEERENKRIEVENNKIKSVWNDELKSIKEIDENHPNFSKIKELVSDINLEAEEIKEIKSNLKIINLIKKTGIFEVKKEINKTLNNGEGEKKSNPIKDWFLKTH